jgi:hypothetical protein
MLELPPYPQFKKDLSEAEEIKEQLDLVMQKAEESGNTEEIEKLLKIAREKRSQIESRMVPKEIKANFQNPETQENKEISLNFEQELKFFTDFYQKHLNLPINQQEIKEIWRKNQKEIKVEMEKYGYDSILIIPENLPSEEILNQKIIETMTNTTETYQSDNFKKGGSFSGVKNLNNSSSRILLTHSDQNIYQNPKANPFLKSTLKKSIVNLSGLSEQEIQKRIENQAEIPINFEINLNNQKIQIQSEWLSLSEYQLFQRIYFEKNQKHLDESGWTWLAKSASASRLVGAFWLPGDRRFGAIACGSSSSGGGLCSRLSCSFKN